MASLDSVVAPRGDNDDDPIQVLEDAMRIAFFIDNPMQSSDEKGCRRHSSSISDRPRYTYRPLDTNSNIRLLTLYPGSESDELEGSLTRVSMKNVAPYEAVSYTWGCSDEPFVIHIDGCSLRLTESAFTALRRFRSRDVPRTLWIDSLCIDQDNMDEKSLQVEMMDHIYSSASRVLCWLGEDEERDAAITFELLIKVRYANFTILQNDLLTTDFMLENDLPCAGDLCWYAVARFFERPWFRRLWVIQEFVLGNDPVIICGDSEAHWKTLMPGVNLLVQYSMMAWGSARRQWEQHPEIFFPTIPEGMMGIGTFHTMFTLKLFRSTDLSIPDAMQFLMNRDQKTLQSNSMHCLRLASAVYSGCDTQTFNDSAAIMLGYNDTSVLAFFIALMKELGAGTTFGSGVTPLWGLLTDFPCSITTDPRDRFYAFLGLSEEKGTPALRPDYSESVESTCLRFARYFMLGPKCRDNGDGMPLIEAGLTRHSTTYDLPTWLSDYTYVPNSRMFVKPGLKNGVYRAAGATQRVFRDNGIPREIAVAGSFIDSIARVIPQPKYPSQAETSFAAFFNQIDAITTRRQTPYPFLHPGESHLDVQWRTLIANTSERAQLADESYGMAFVDDKRRMLRTPPSIDTMEKAAEDEGIRLSLDWSPRWILLARDYAVCETESGLIGLVPHGTRVGDSVWVVLGENMPLVLRRSEQDWTKYRIYGACYIHGIMGGEALGSKYWHEEEIVLV